MNIDISSTHSNSPYFIGSDKTFPYWLLRLRQVVNEGKKDYDRSKLFIYLLAASA